MYLLNKHATLEKYRWLWNTVFAKKLLELVIFIDYMDTLYKTIKYIWSSAAIKLCYRETEQINLYDNRL